MEQNIGILRKVFRIYIKKYVIYVRVTEFCAMTIKNKNYFFRRLLIVSSGKIGRFLADLTDREENWEWFIFCRLIMVSARKSGENSA